MGGGRYWRVLTYFGRTIIPVRLGKPYGYIYIYSIGLHSVRNRVKHWGGGSFNLNISGGSL